MASPQLASFRVPEVTNEPMVRLAACWRRGDLWVKLIVLPFFLDLVVFIEGLCPEHSRAQSLGRGHCSDGERASIRSTMYRKWQASEHHSTNSLYI